ncbi:Pentatricopeptide repeat-containing protein [Drosera capensis]
MGRGFHTVDPSATRLQSLQPQSTPATIRAIKLVGFLHFTPSPSPSPFPLPQFIFAHVVTHLGKTGISKFIYDHPFPDSGFRPALARNVSHGSLSVGVVENVLGRLFAAHVKNLKPSCDSFEKTLHILTRMRYFDQAWDLMEEIGRLDPSLLTLKSMSIMLLRIAMFGTYEETLARMEKDDSGNMESVELFYHEMVKRGFKLNTVTYNIRIDGYCEKRCFGDGLKLLRQMENANCSPILETITTLIQGAGLVRNIARAWELFNELPARKLVPDIGVYNALMSSLGRMLLMDEMEEKHIGPDHVTYHTLFYGLMRTRGIEVLLYE